MHLKFTSEIDTKLKTLFLKKNLLSLYTLDKQGKKANHKAHDVSNSY